MDKVHGPDGSPTALGEYIEANSRCAGALVDFNVDFLNACWRVVKLYDEGKIPKYFSLSCFE